MEYWSISLPEGHTLKAHNITTHAEHVDNYIIYHNGKILLDSSRPDNPNKAQVHYKKGNTPKTISEYTNLFTSTSATLV